MSIYQSKYTGEEIDKKLDDVNKIATSEEVGGIKVGEGLEITEDGTLNALVSATGGSSSEIEKVELLNEEVVYSMGAGITNVNQTVSLKENIENYDMLVLEFDFYWSDGYGMASSQVYVPSNIIYNNSTTRVLDGSQFSLIVAGSTSQYVIDGWFKNENELFIQRTMSDQTSATVSKARIRSITGIKLKASGGSSAEGISVSQITNLFEGSAGVGDITLTDNLENYDFIYVEASCSDSGNTKCERDTRMIDVSTIEYLKDGNIYANTYNLASMHGKGSYYRIYFGFKNNTTLNVIAVENSGWSAPVIHKVMGVKKGTSVSNGIVSGSNVSQEVLWEGAISSTNQVAELSDSLENYDYIGVAWKYSSSSYVRIMPISWLDVQSIKDGKYASSVMFPTTAFVNVRDSMSRQVMYSFPSATQLKYGDAMAPSSDSSVTKTITRVIGVKINESATGSSGGSGYSETELLDAPVDCTLKTAVTVLNQELVLSDDIANYDQIVFEVSLTGTYILTNQHTFLVSGITYNPSNNYVDALQTHSIFPIGVFWEAGGAFMAGSATVYFKNGTTLGIGYTALRGEAVYNKLRIRSIKGIKY